MARAFSLLEHPARISQQPKHQSTSEMVKHKVFGVERDIDVSVKNFPSPERLQELEAPLDANGCQHGWFPSTFVGNRKRPKTIQLHYRFFLPSIISNNNNNNNNNKNNNSNNKNPTPKAVVVFMHGLQNHSGCAYIMPTSKSKRNMAALSTEFLSRDMAVYAFDLLGHGYSEGHRFVLPSADVLINDYLQFVQLVQQKHSDIPLFLMGESLGGNLTLQVARHYQDHPDERPQHLAGLALIAPAIYPTNIYWPQQSLFYAISPFVGRWRPPAWIPSPIQEANIWRDPERIALAHEPNGIQAPPSQHPPYLSLWTLCVLMRRVRDSVIPGLATTALCVAHGVKDIAIPIEGSEWLVQQVVTEATGLPDCPFKAYPEALHDLLSEPEAEEMLVWLADWMCERIEKQQKPS